MTIVVGVAAPDGIVLAADSRTTLTDGDRHRIASDTAQKIFSVCNRFCIATFGAAFVGTDTIIGLMDEFVITVEGRADELDVDGISGELGKFFEDRVSTAVENAGGAYPDDAPFLGFLVAGYEAGGKVGEFREVGVPGPTVTDPGITTTTLGILWRGQIDAIGRLMHGIDWTLIDRSKLEQATADMLTGFAYQLIDPLTLQDAVDEACFLVRTTVDMQRFSDGTHASPGAIPGCGGETLVALVTRKGVEWVVERTVRSPTRSGVAEGTLLAGA